MFENSAIQRRLAVGWNTWNPRNMLSHVLLPQGLAINLAIKEYREGGYLKEALIGRWQDGVEQVTPGPNAYDGSYTKLTVCWRDITMIVESATDGDDQVLLVTPSHAQVKTPLLVVEVGMLWNRPGMIEHADGHVRAHLPGRDVPVYTTVISVEEPFVECQTPYFALPMDGQLGVSTGRVRSLDEIRAIVATRRADWQASIDAYGDLADVYEAVQTGLSWNTIYDPKHDRVFSTVSRFWSTFYWGSYILYCWDTFFAALLAGIDNRDLAYANVHAIVSEAMHGFLPSSVSGLGFASHSWSQPPVGGIVIRELYRKYGDDTLIAEIFDTMLAWNRWWPEQRLNHLGLLSWGVNEYPPITGNIWEHNDVVHMAPHLGAMESALDNSPMYDDVPYNPDTRRYELANVGLNSLYVADCQALAELAEAMGRPEADELRRRGDHFTMQLQTLWDDDAGIFRNRRTDTGEFSPHLSPTSFYPLLGKVASDAQASRMINEHLLNPTEFWGEWVIPSIARNDPAYPEQHYWRGPIWAPMNILVYLGLRNYALPEVQEAFAAKSQHLLLLNWLADHHVHENYNADTGQGQSDPFYHWGGLLGVIAFLEHGAYAGEEHH